MSPLNPFVFWTQNNTTIQLKVDLKGVKDAKIELDEHRLIFAGCGKGAQGLNNYTFTINFEKKLINVEKSSYNITDRGVYFNLVKKKDGIWPELLSSNSPWLQSQNINHKKDNAVLKLYLILYNLVICLGFMYIFCTLLARFFKHGTTSIAGTYEAVRTPMSIFTLLQLLEVFHAIIGYVKGGYWVPLLQIGGRVIIVFAMLDYEPQLQVMSVTFFLFFAWSAAESVRYPYYILQILEKESKLFTWLRYSSWMVLYPLGLTCEGVVFYNNIYFLNKDNRWFTVITWPFGFTFRVSQVLQIYLYFFIVPVAYILMSHMYKKRQAKYKSKKSKNF